MHVGYRFFAATLLFGLFYLMQPVCLFSQTPSTGATLVAAAEIPDAPQPHTSDSAAASQQDQTADGQTHTGKAAQNAAGDPTAIHTPPPEPKRILGMMPNYRAVSAGVIPPPPTPREAFTIATQNTFDYSAFVFVGITSLLAEGTNTHPQLGKGVGGFYAYSWRGFLDKTDANYMIDWLMPTFLHQDERYFAKGEGGIVKRGVYAATRILITPDYHGKNTFNTSEILGRGVSEAISLPYYPSDAQTAGAYTSKYMYSLGRDALTNVFRELWPDVNARLFHRRN